MKVNFSDLQLIQQKVDNKIMEKVNRDIAPYEILTAMHVEVFEFINAIGSWKWWKHNHKIDREKVLDELADIMAFYILFWSKYSILASNMNITKADAIVQEVLESLEGRESNNIIYSISNVLNNGGENGFNPPVLVALCIKLATIAIDGLTWGEIEDAYLAKSNENIQRQERNY